MGGSRKKKIAIGVVVLLLALVMSATVISVTYARFRDEVTSSGAAHVAGAIADYNRGTVYRNGNQIEYNYGADGISFSDLQPGDGILYTFSVCGYRQNGADLSSYSFNMVKLEVICEFSFVFSKMGDNGITSEYLSAYGYPGEGGTNTEQVNVGFRYGADHSTITDDNIIATDNSGDEIGFYDCKDSSSEFTVTQYRTTEGGDTVYTQKIGFYMYPVSSTADVGAEQILGFYVTLPSQSSGGDEESQCQLVCNIDIYCRQVTD